MAARHPDAPALQIDTVSAREGQDTLRRLRAGRGGRSSAYQPLLDRLRVLPEGEVVRVEGVSKGDVNTLRAYLYRHLSRDVYRVKSVHEATGDTFTVVVGRWADGRG